MIRRITICLLAALLVLPVLSYGEEANQELVDGFRNRMIHDVLATVATMRPSVDISLSE